MISFEYVIGTAVVAGVMLYIIFADSLPNSFQVDYLPDGEFLVDVFFTQITYICR